MKNKVYLAGGLSSNWRNIIINQLENEFVFFNPKEHGLEGCSKAYTTWDLHFLRNSDILFGYMEKDNPSGYGLSLEIGYANALGKTVILIDERSEIDDFFEKRYRIVHSSSNIVFSSINEGVDFLRSFSSKKIYNFD